MTEDVRSHCARGCTVRCRSDQCAEAGQHDHPPLHRQATVGNLCERCAELLTDWLSNIGLRYPLLDLYGRGAPDNGGIRHTKISGSPSLINLNVMAMTDTATNQGDGVISVPAALCEWANNLAEDLGLYGRADNLTAALDMLTTWKTQLCARPWIGDMFDEVHDVHRLLAQVTDAPKPVGRCFGRIMNKPDCGQLLYPPDTSLGHTAIECTKCGRVYSGLDLVRLELSGRKETG